MLTKRNRTMMSYDRKNAKSCQDLIEREPKEKLTRSLSNLGKAGVDAAVAFEKFDILGSKR